MKNAACASMTRMLVADIELSAKYYLAAVSETKEKLQEVMEGVNNRGGV